MTKKIAFEEHVMCPGFEEYWRTTVADFDPSLLKHAIARLADFGELRLEAMNRAGIERAILSLSGPGMQAEPDVSKAIGMARDANEFLARQIERCPDRYGGFAHLALQDPVAGADELERCMKELGFCGAMINGHTLGRYLDDPFFYPFWERADVLGAVIYLHPADPVAKIAALEGHPGLRRATWEWTVETASHALRLVFSGLFDRFPRAVLALGHLGETLPYLLWRLDSRAKLYGVKLAKRPSDYIREHFVVTTSGMCSAAPLHCAISALGRERVMFSVDYPYEDAGEAAEFIETVPLDPSVRDDICFNNAKKLFRI